MARPIHSQSAQNGLNGGTTEAIVDVGRYLSNWTAGSGPLYRRLADALRGAIQRADLPGGARLPAERQLAQQMLISRSTIVAAYDLLSAEELIERRVGSGTHVRHAAPASRPAEPGLGLSRSLGRNTLFRRLAEEPGQTIDFVGAYLLEAGGLPASVLTGIEAEVATLSRQSGYAPLGYPPLRRTIANRLTRLGLPTTQEEVMVTNGAQQAVYLAASLYLRPGDTVIVENPTYPGALDAFTTAGARLAWISTGRQGADVEAMAELAARVNPRLAYLIPTYQNPTGGVMSEQRRRSVAQLIQQRQLTLIDDQSLAAMGLGGEPPPPIACFAPDASVLTIDSVSKLAWGGLRVGWVRAPDRLIEQLGRLRAVADLGGSLPAQVIAVRLLEAFDEVRHERSRQLIERMELMSSLLGGLLPSWTWERPLGGLCLWVRLPLGSATDFAQVALRHGVSIVAGPVASPDGSFGDYLRLPFGNQPAALEEGVRRLAVAWNAYAPTQEPRRQTLAVIV